MTNLFYQTYQSISKNKIWSLLVLILLVGSLFFLASKIQFEEDITKLIPSNSKTQEVQKVLKSVNFTDKIVVNISKQKQGDVNDLTQYASQFLDSIDSGLKDYVKNIQGKVNDEDIGATIDFVYNNAPIFLAEKDYEIITKKIEKDSIDTITQSNYKTLLSPTGIVAKKTLLKDPLGISFIALEKLQQLGAGDQFTVKNGFLLSKNENNLLLFISPTFSSSETDKNTFFASKLYEIQESLNNVYKNKVKSEYFGAALIAVANAEQIKNDIQFTVGIALTVLILIFVFFYRKLTIPIILFTPTLFGGLLSIALLYLIRGKISAISLGIGSVLLGVTLDYSLHILTHIRNNHPIESLYKDITKPILMSSLTTALAFLCLLFLDSQALQDLGIFAAVSVIGASVFALLFIPQVYKGGVKREIKVTILDKIAAYNYHKNKWIIGVIVLFCVLSAFTYNNVIFNKDISKLNYEPPAATTAKNNLDSLTNIASKSIYIASYGKTTQAALSKNDSVYTKLQKLKDSGVIISFSSVGALVHSEKIQQEKIARWNQFWTPKVINETKENLIESGSKLGFKSTTFNQFYNYLENDFEPLTIEDYNEITTFSLDDYIATEGDFTTVTSLVKVDEVNAQKVKDDFKDSDQILAIDRQEMNETLLGNLKNDFNNLIGYSLIVVLLILFVSFRSLSLTLVTAIPIFLTWFVTVGVMGFLEIEFNIFNIIISTFIFGLGIDYSIFITNGMLKEYQTGEKTVATHKTSIILSVITTILGVGVLIFAKHPALYSISVVSIIGIFSAVLIAFTLQPLLFILFIGSKTKSPITLRLLLHSVLSFGYYGLGGLFLSLFSVSIMKIIPFSKKVKMKWFHTTISKFMKSVLYTNPFVKKKIINLNNEDFKKPGIIIANHTSFLDILAIGMLHPKIIFLVNDWVYNSPIFGKAVQLAGFYPVSGGIENGVEHLKTKVAQGYTLMAFPEGTRSTTNKIRRFHKGAFYLAEQLNLDIIPVLIHGNSEVLPKGSFVIKNGSITVKILNRISPENTLLGNSYKERTKQISSYFRKEFASLRNQIEKDTYFHSVVKEDFRYKGDVLYSEISKELKRNSKVYKTILDAISKNGIITNISNGKGQLDFLLLLDSADRKIITLIEDKEVREIVANSFISNHYNKITYATSLEEALKPESDTIILNIKDFKLIKSHLLQHNLDTIILLDELDNFKTEELNKFGYQIIHQTYNLIIFKKKDPS